MPYLWNKPPPQSFFSMAKMKPFKEYPSINPHPEIIEKFMEGGQLINNKPKQHQKQQDETVPKKKKKRLPGEKLLKKLTKHKDSDAEEKKLKRIVSAIKSNLNKLEDY